jgi:glycosyltransferase involved in cell wall biosynthesis
MELITWYPDLKFEYIIVNDGSLTANYEAGKPLLRQTPIRLIEYTPNKGKGEALRTGVRASTGDIVIYTDIDFPYTLDSVSEVIDLLIREHKNVVIGIKDASYYEHVPPFRKFISKLFRSFIRVFFRIPTDDTQCGLKGFDRMGKEIFLRTTIDRYLFDLEFVFLAARDPNISIATREIKLREDVQFSRMNFGILRNEFWNFLKIFFRALLKK